MGGGEPNLCGCILTNTAIPDLLIHQMLTGAGIQFLNKYDIKQYVKKHTNACMNSSILCVWSGTTHLQGKTFYEILDKKISNQPRICAQALEPFYFMNDDNYHFDKVFMNKKVLIITSHKQTNEKQ